jgi:scyllo-inositol 2-dehydrogenase (NAD+)
MTKEGIAHDVVPHFMQRFEDAYLMQIQDFVHNALNGAEPSISGRDGIAALQIGVAATESWREGRPVAVRCQNGRAKAP